VGIAVATPAGVALAAPPDSSTTPSPSAGTTASGPTDEHTATGKDASEAPAGDGAADGASASKDPVGEDADPSPSSSTVDVAPGVAVSSSGGAHTSSKTDDDTRTQKARKPQAGARSPSTKKASAPTVHVTAQTNAGPAAGPDPVTTAKTAAPVAASPVEAKTAPSPVTFVLSSVVRPILSSFLGAIPGTPTESPLAWIFAAAARRQVGQTEEPTMEAATFAVAAAALPANNPPKAGVPTVGTPNATTGAVTGTLGVTDADKDVLAYTVTGAPTKGTVIVKSTGTYTYTPTAVARHAASTVNAPSSLTGDAFTVSASDGRGGVVATTVKVPVLPANKIPTVTASAGTPSSTTGVVKVTIIAKDADLDTLTYKASTPAKGSVVVGATGAVTYTPTAAARHAAARTGATTAVKSDTFTVTVADGHGGVASVPVTVQISPANATPTGAAATGVFTNLNSGRVTGTITAVDTDRDSFTYKSTAPTKGVLVLRSDGTFSYTPTAAARQAASATNASSTTKTDSVTFTVADGYGGTTTVAVRLPVAPYGHVDVAPTNGRATVADPTLAIGAVTGTVTADDAERDTFTFKLATGPARGLASVNATTGAFTYVPDVNARYRAKATAGVDTDTFTVTVNDGYGGTTTATVKVAIAPPSTSALAIDQRATTVAMNAQEMLIYSQADTDKALDLLKANGVDTIRILIPWAQVEPTNDAFTGWAAVDRMVNSATARNMKVLGVLNSTPTWAGVSGGAPLAAAPASPQEFAEFAGVVAARYAGKIGAYEIWNEPNGFQFWSPTPNAAAYTAILKAAYPVIKAADPNAVVVAAGLGAVITYGNLTIDPVTYLQQMYASGAAGSFDALSYHPYLYTKLFSTPSPYPTAPINQVKALHDLMVANGDGNKKIWATEYGEPAGIVSETSQAAYIGDFLRAWRNLDYAGPAFIHTIRDYTSSSPNSATFGVFRKDWSAKPAVGVIKTVINENKAIIAGTNYL
jgi:VCBS repeat-containing protein